MKAIQCELCGSNQLIKKDGFFQCEFCGTKYTLEEARKLFVSGSVSIEGDVKTKDADFIIKAGKLKKYNGESVDVVIPNHVKVLGSYSFNLNRGIEKVVIPESVTKIEKLAFHGCTSLTAITIPESVTTIERGAFYGCTALDPNQVKMSPSKVPIFDGTRFVELGYCIYCAGALRKKTFGGFKCTVCGAEYR